MKLTACKENGAEAFSILCIMKRRSTPFQKRSAPLISCKVGGEHLSPLPALRSLKFPSKPMRPRLPRRIPKPQKINRPALIIYRIDNPIGRARQLEQLRAVGRAGFVEERKGVRAVGDEMQEVVLKRFKIFQRDGLARFSAQIAEEIADVFSGLRGAPDRVRHNQE